MLSQPESIVNVRANAPVEGNARHASQGVFSVMHLITDLKMGGAERFLQRLVSQEMDQPVRHSVVSLMDDGALGPEIEANGVEVRTLGLAGAGGIPAVVSRLSRHLRAERPDVLMTWLYHADLFGTLAHMAAPKSALIWNIRCADMDLSSYRRSTRALPHILARLSRRPDLVVANSEAGRAVHERYGYRPRSWSVLPNGVDTTQFRPDPATREKVHAMLGIPQAAPVVALCARVDPMKDHATFLAAAAEVARARPDARFLLIGRDTDQAGIDRMMAPHPGLASQIIRLGERSDIAQLLTACDVAVSSSLTEGFSNTLLEAMACGVPCVATDVGASADIVGDTGRVVPKANAWALAAGILDLASLSAESRAKLGEAARAHVSRNFSLAATAAKYAEVFRNAALRRARASAA